MQTLQIRLKSFLTIFLSVLVVFTFVSDSFVGADSNSDLQSILNNTAYYNGDGGSGSTSGCSSSGNGTPTGASFPDLSPTSMANAINTYINTYYPSSEFANQGSLIVADAQNSNINPFLIVAIAQAESSLATPGPTQYDLNNANNAFSRSATSSQPHINGAGVNASTLWYLWTSSGSETGVEVSVDYQASQNIQNDPNGGGDFATYLRDEYSSQIDSDSLVDLFEAYDPGDPGYASTVENTVAQLVTMTGQTTTNSSDCGSGAGLANFVYYSQCDSRWGSDPYGDPGDTICSSGCGPTSVAMVVATLANSSVTPDQIATLSMETGGYDPGVGTAWGFFVSGTEHYGLKATDLETNIEQAVAVLNQGGLVIAAGTGAAPFTTEGHIIVLRGISDGNIVVADPDPAHTQTQYSVNDIVTAGLQDLVGVTQ